MPPDSLQRPALISGADDALLGNLFMLLEGLAQTDPGAALHVCDFGFSQPARRFLQALGCLLPRPAILGQRRHPWYAKAAMADYLAPDQKAGGFVWIDADIIPLHPVLPALDAELAAMTDAGQSFALCPDAAGGSLDDFITTWQARGSDTAPFSALLDRHGVSGDRPYLNTGFLICRDAGLASAWRDLTFRQSEWILFEQNSFNCLAHLAGERMRLLDTAVWNRHGALLDTADPADPRGILLHATSEGDRHVSGPANIPVGDNRLPLTLKLLLRDDLRERQMALLRGFIARHAEMMRHCGLLVPTAAR